MELAGRRTFHMLQLVANSPPFISRTKTVNCTYSYSTLNTCSFTWRTQHRRQ